MAPDGSPVALYLALPGDDDARLIHAAIPEGSEVLELGCGVGRVTRPLVDLGHRVTGVDNSPAMLAAFPPSAGVKTVLADIESLELGRRFGVVVLGSHMINGQNGGAFLAAAARHVTDDGAVVVQRHAPGWIDRVEPTVTERHGIVFALTDVSHPDRGVVAAECRYTVAGATYRQPFVAFEVDDDRLDHLAQSVGLSVDRYINDDPSWVKLVPLTPPADDHTWTSDRASIGSARTATTGPAPDTSPARQQGLLGPLLRRLRTTTRRAWCRRSAHR
jgi:SAM-dependent methyltransferase